MNIEAYQRGASIAQTVDTLGRLADQIANTEFVPKAMRGKPAVVLACMMYGAELGLGPMQALRLIDIIEGTPALKPEGMRAMVRQAGHKIWPEVRDGQSCTMAGYRAEDGPEMTVRATWGADDAKRAGLSEKSNYKKMPRAMYDARATAELCRLHFADVIGGLSYVQEEIEDFDGPVMPAAPRYVPPAAVLPSPVREEQGEPFPMAALTPAPAAATRRRPPPAAAAVPAPGVPVEAHDDGELADKKQIQEIVKLATSVDEDGDPIESTQLQVLTFGSTAGRTDKLDEMTVREADKLHGYVISARAGRLPSTYAERADDWLAWTEKQNAGVPA